MEIFHRIGLAGAFRIAHVIVAIMWMGLLWFFNFVQTPAYAEMDAARAQRRVRQAHVARAVVVPLGGRGDGRVRPADHRGRARRARLQQATSGSRHRGRVRRSRSASSSAS